MKLEDWKRLMTREIEELTLLLDEMGKAEHEALWSNWMKRKVNGLRQLVDLYERDATEEIRGAEPASETEKEQETTVVEDPQPVVEVVEVSEVTDVPDATAVSGDAENVVAEETDVPDVATEEEEAAVETSASTASDEVKKTPVAEVQQGGTLADKLAARTERIGMRIGSVKSAIPRMDYFRYRKELVGGDDERMRTLLERLDAVKNEDDLASVWTDENIDVACKEAEELAEIVRRTF